MERFASPGLPANVFNELEWANPHNYHADKAPNKRQTACGVDSAAEIARIVFIARGEVIGLVRDPPKLFRFRGERRERRALASKAWLVVAFRPLDLAWLLDPQSGGVQV